MIDEKSINEFDSVCDRHGLTPFQRLLLKAECSALSEIGILWESRHRFKGNTIDLDLSAIRVSYTSPKFVADDIFPVESMGNESNSDKTWFRRHIRIIPEEMT